MVNLKSSENTRIMFSGDVIFLYYYFSVSFSNSDKASLR